MGNWRKSTYSDANGGNCIEAADAPGAVLVRDTKDNGRGPVVTVTSAAWRSFTAGLK